MSNTGNILADVEAFTSSATHHLDTAYGAFTTLREAFDLLRRMLVAYRGLSDSTEQYHESINKLRAELATYKGRWDGVADMRVADEMAILDATREHMLDFTTAIYDRIGDGPLPPPGELSFEGMMTITAALMTRDYVTARGFPLKSKCAWCVMAAGDDDAAWRAAPSRDRADAAAHSLVCEANPLANWRKRYLELTRLEPTDDEETVALAVAIGDMRAELKEMGP